MRRMDIAAIRMVALMCLAAGMLAAGKGQRGTTASSTDDAALSQPLAMSKVQRQDAFRQVNPGTMLMERAGRIERIHGAAFSRGENALASAEAFRAEHALMLGVPATELVASDLPAAAGADAAHADSVPHVQPVMFDRATGRYRFTAVNYRQVRDGFPVFRSRLVTLVRNEADFPLVLANPDVRDLGAFCVDAQLAGKVNANLPQIANNRYGAGSQVVKSNRVIWAGVDDMLANPRLADQSIVVSGDNEWLLLTDVATGSVLYDENLICFGTVSGGADGNATQGIGSEQCESEAPTAMPYLRVTSGAATAFADVNGSFVIDPAAGSITATPSGMWFNVMNAAGAVETVSVPASSPANLLFNAANATQQVRAQTNAYIEANRVRDFVLAYHPAYPTLQTQSFPVTVNLTGGLCPGNAWFSPTEVSINFCLSGPSNPNTAWSSVIHHEYGHNLVQAAGSGQGAYGEGMGDVMSALILDDPCLGLGFFNNCTGCLRNATQNCQYQTTGCSSCGSEIHACGVLLSGCVWSTRNQLAISKPADYIDILANLAINAMLVHTGTSITPAITVDYLTLDDDNDDIADGTPHHAQIAAGFGAHNMAAPPLAPIKFVYPNGRPQYVLPAGGTTIRVHVQPLSGAPQPGSGKFFVDSGSGFVQATMLQVAPNVYDAVFPAAPCGTAIRYYVQAQSTTAQTINSPGSAPTNPFAAVSAAGAGPVVFSDDFQADFGWAVLNSPGLTTGQWQRGAPVASMAAPSSDADGSGQCYVTDNTAGNDVDNGSSTLTSPVLDASAPAPVLSYWRWYNNNTGASPQADIMVVEFSTNGGASWNSLETVGPSTASPNPEVNGGWFQKSFNLVSIPGFVSSNQFRVRFTVGDLGSGSYVEAAVDGVKVDSLICIVNVPGDVNGDFDVNIDDLLSVINAWGPCAGCPQDLDDDGDVDIDDLLAVINGWT
jgi:hypothetical protein